MAQEEDAERDFTLFGLICFYDEPVETLVNCVVGLARAGVDHVVAVDGAYALYPDAQPASHPDQHAAIHVTARAMGMRLTVHTPDDPWEGNEVEKRTFMHRLAWAMSEPGDWHLVMDADQVVIRQPEDFRERLANTKEDVGQTTFTERGTEFMVRNIFRGDKLVRLRRNHYTYVTEDGKFLWASEKKPLEPCADFKDVLVDHRVEVRPRDRVEKRLLYYQQRDLKAIELFECELCDHGQAVVRLPHNWRRVVLYEQPVAEWVEVCSACATRVERENKMTLKRLGMNPKEVVVRHQPGKLPVSS